MGTVRASRQSKLMPCTDAAHRGRCTIRLAPFARSVNAQLALWNVCTTVDANSRFLLMTFRLVLHQASVDSAQRAP